MVELYTEKYLAGIDKPWIVFLHGFGGSIQMWKKQVSKFKDKFNLFLVDLPGHGKSQQSLHDNHMTHMSDVADVVVDNMKANGIYRATFMCVSLGTMIFTSILMRYPNIVDTAVLCGAVSGMGIGYRSLLAAADWIKHTVPYMTTLTMFAYVLMPFEGHSKSRGFFISSGRILGRKEFMSWFKVFVRDLNIMKKIKNIKQKILFIMGDEDFVFLSGVERKCEKLANASIEIIEHCGHVCNIQKANEFNKLAEQHINKIYGIA